jgi:hypothetical protein
LIVAVVVGFRGSGPKPVVLTRRAAVADYITRVGKVEVAMAQQVRAVDRSYRKFGAKPKALASEVGRYRKAQATLALLRDRLQFVAPPRDARRLHLLLVRLADQNVAMAGVVTELASYLPALSRAQAPLGPAINRLRTGINKAKSARRQAVAFETYAAETKGIASRIAALRAPSFFVAAKNAELVQIRRLNQLAGEIAVALRHKQAIRAQALVGQLSTVEAETTVLRAQRAGALAYNARLARIETTAKAIEKERRRLEKKVPAS